MKRHLLYMGLTALASLVRGQSLPYNPSNIFLLPDRNLAYIFRPSSHSPNQAQLFAYDYAKPFQSAASSFTTVTESLPFLEEGKNLAFSPTISADGNITAIAGDCSQGAAGIHTWVFRAEEGKKPDGTGVWSQVDTSSRNVGSDEDNAGANFLAPTLSFSRFADASDGQAAIYSFGGMCPDNGSTSETWQKDAEYSNLMLSISRQDSAAGPATYAVSALQNRGPPIAQAGATITGLQVAYSSSLNSDQRVQQQDFVLLAGHTQTAFINTSQVALFSLPQASWSFMPVQQPTNSKTDLSKRQAIEEVTPRSGHTAVLSENGNSIVVFGGWVGNVNTPASPQLAILDIGAGGDWSWQIPDQSDSKLPEDTGLYGHGAAILPGNVMMIVGGYSTGGSSAKLARRAGQTPNDQVLFYNVSSGSWLETYSPPAGVQSSNGSVSQYPTKVGLGTGLGLGAAFLVSAVVFYFWYTRRLKKNREERQRNLLAHSSDGSLLNMYDQPYLNDGGFDGRGGDEAAVGRFWSSAGTPGSYPQPPEMQHTTGMFVNMPSPTRGLRRGSGKSYQYHAAPRFDENRNSRSGAGIHPIAEQANEDDDDEAGKKRSGSDDLTDAERKLRDLESVLMSVTDPFADPQPDPLRSHPVSPEAPTSPTVMRISTGSNRTSYQKIPRKPLPNAGEGSNWTVERAPGEAIQEDDNNGRVSPTKSSDERTSSTLSERSTHTITSDTSITRTMSTRTGALMAAAAAAYRSNNAPGNTSPTEERTRTMSSNGGRKSPYYFTRPRSSTAGSAHAPGGRNSMIEDAESFTTARSNFLDLQSEGEALLGGRPAADRDDPYQRAFAAQSTARPGVPSLPSLGSVQQRRKPGLMGSLRRAINAVSTVGDRSFSLTSSAEPYGRHDDTQASSSSSPTRERGIQIGSAPRRAVSDGGALLKQKRGQKDWQDDTEFPPYRDDPNANDWGEPRSSAEKKRDEEDWDVEGEASRRDVQVMFTIPKTRLRVVNDDMDRASLRSASDGAVSRHNSIKELRSQESLKTIRARSDGEKVFLPPTQEVTEEIEKDKEKAA